MSIHHGPDNMVCKHCSFLCNLHSNYYNPHLTSDRPEVENGLVTCHQPPMEGRAGVQTQVCPLLEPRTFFFKLKHNWFYYTVLVSSELTKQFRYMCLCVCAYSVSFVWLCSSMDCSPPGSSVHGIFQARILEQVAISHSRGSSQPRGRTCVCCGSCIGRQILYH